MYIKEPDKIEEKSFEIIRSNIKKNFSDKELKVVMRTIHTTGDYDYENIVDIRNNAIEEGVNALLCGTKIFTDTRMAYSGINKRKLNSLNCTIDCFIDNEDVFKNAKENGITRSMAAIDRAVNEGFDIYVIGNAPTALFRLLEHIENNKTSPKLIVGVPVGFVGAAESKEKLREYKIPQISTIGTKGGSNVAAAILNALIYMVMENV